MTDYLIITEYFIHVLILLGIVGGLSVWSYLASKNKDKRDSAVAPILFLVHSLLFFTLSSFNIIDRSVYIIWRDLIFFHALTIFLTMGILEIRAREGR